MDCLLPAHFRWRTSSNKKLAEWVLKEPWDGDEFLRWARFELCHPFLSGLQIRR